MPFILNQEPFFFSMLEVRRGVFKFKHLRPNKKIEFWLVGLDKD